jgi:cold shock protein
LPNGIVIDYTAVNQRTAACRQSLARWRQFGKSLRETKTMAEGTIKKLTDKGFGFISTGGAKDLFFHSSSVQGVTFEELREGQKVSFTEGQGKKGPCAENVKPV